MALGVCTSTAKAAPADEDFAVKAAAAGKKEVELGKLATRQAQSVAVKTFARRMVSDHTKAGNKLNALAMRKTITVPAEIDADAKAAMDQLSNLKGAEFDRAYMQMMVADHEKAVADFQTEASAGADADLKAFATTTLPTLKTHLSMARETAAKVK
jgi:putative membrane protein